MVKILFIFVISLKLYRVSGYRIVCVHSYFQSMIAARHRALYGHHGVLGYYF